jgi:hypothetical protein
MDDPKGCSRGASAAQIAGLPLADFTLHNDEERLPAISMAALPVDHNEERSPTALAISMADNPPTYYSAIPKTEVVCPAEIIISGTIFTDPYVTNPPLYNPIVEYRFVLADGRVSNKFQVVVLNRPPDAQPWSPTNEVTKVYHRVPIPFPVIPKKGSGSGGSVPSGPQEMVQLDRGSGSGGPLPSGPQQEAAHPENHHKGAISLRIENLEEGSPVISSNFAPYYVVCKPEPESGGGGGNGSGSFGSLRIEASKHE